VTGIGEPTRPSRLGWAARGSAGFLLAVLVLVFPLSRSPVEVNIYTEAVVFAIVGLSLNVLIGYTGQISLGHQAFVGVGAFTSAYLVTVHGQPFPVGVLVAMVVGAAQAVLLGAVSLRITGLYFALVTLAYGRMAEGTLFQLQSLTGGAAGMAAPKPAAFHSDYRYYYLSLGLLAIVVLVDQGLTSTKAGRALSALREDPRVACTLGVNVKSYTLLGFATSGAIAGLGGALWAHNTTTVVSNQFDFQLALVFVVMTVVGGLRSRAGVVVGSAFFSLLHYFFDRLHVDRAVNALPFLPRLLPDLAPIVIGPILLLSTLTRHPGGWGEILAPFRHWLRGGRWSEHRTAEPARGTADVRA